jgi:hypothetical protein
MYNIKNYKTFKGHEGETCAQGTLHGPAGKVADWSDDSWGGSMMIRFTKAAEEAKFIDWAKTQLPAHKDYDGKPYDPTTMTAGDIVETMVATMSYAVGEERELMKQAKKGIAYFLPDAKSHDGKSLYVWSVAYTAKNVAKLRADHPQADIINERLKLPLVDDATADLAARNKRLKAACRSATVFTLRKADGTNADMKLGVPYSAAIAAGLRAKHGANLVEIVNERFC